MASQRTGDDFKQAYEVYGDMLYKQAMVYLKNPSDCEDVLQDVFIKLLYKAPPFKDAEHEKRWLLRITINRCKDALRSYGRRKTVPLDAILEQGVPQDDRALLAMVMALPTKYKAVVHLYYYEGYSTSEIAKILGITPSAVKMRLSRGRAQLKLEMEDQYEA